MKKQLMTTTALVAAGVVAMSGVALGASKPKMAVGGGFSSIISAANQDTTGLLGLDVWQDSELHFKGSVKLDSGVKISTKVEMEAQQGNTTVDEAYMAISGPFGQIKLGSEDSAANLLVNGTFGSNATNAGRHLGIHTPKSIVAPSGHAAASSNVIDLGDGDAERITYFTPRRAGIMLGVSYTPTFNASKNTQETETDSAHHGISVGGHWQGKVGGATIKAAAGYAVASAADDTTDADLSGYAMGVAATFGKVTVAFGSGTEKNVISKSSTGTSTMTAGIKYKAGKDAYSLGYLSSEDDASTAAGTDKTSMAMVSYNRELGAGVTGNINLMYADYEGEVAGNSDDNNGVALQTSINVKF